MDDDVFIILCLFRVLVRLCGGVLLFRLFRVLDRLDGGVLLFRLFRVMDDGVLLLIFVSFSGA